MMKSANLDPLKTRNPYQGAKALKDVASATNASTQAAASPAKDTIGKEAFDVNLSDEAKTKSLEKSTSSIDSKSSEIKSPDLKKPSTTDLKPKPTDLAQLPSLKPDSGSEKKEAKKEVKETKKPSALEADKKGHLKKPGIFFIPGLEMMSSSESSGKNGIRKMAESVTGARIYGWDQKDDVIKEIKKHHIDQPIIMVGHSLGGDTVHEIAEDLNEVENGFRKIDLLVTIDSIGYDNDIVPANVKRNLNIFGDKDIILNDGPHAARDTSKTKILNVIRSEKHTDLDDTKDVQREIIDAIQEILKGKIEDAIHHKDENFLADDNSDSKSEKKELSIKLELS